MLIEEIMTPTVEVIRSDASLQEAAIKMRDLNIGSLPVCDGNQLQGMITDRDIAVRAIAENRNPVHTQVKEIMTTDLYYCFQDQPLQEAAGMMQRHQIRRLPIVNHDKKLVGIIALGDISVDVENPKLAAATLDHILEPAEPSR